VVRADVGVEAEVVTMFETVDRTVTRGLTTLSYLNHGRYVPIIGVIIA
jgi:hypothetical protein